MKKRKATVAYEASQKIEAILNKDGLGLYKERQLQNHLPFSLTYQTTYDEVFILAKEKAFVRPFFHVEENRVHLPVLFAKIHGVSNDRKEYWRRLHALTLLKNSLLIRQFPFHSYVNKDFRAAYRHMLTKDGMIDTERLIQANIWKYDHLAIGLQKGLATAIKQICLDRQLRQKKHETEEDVQVFLFTQALHLPAIILKLLQRFDYAKEIPKLVLYQNGLTGSIARSDAATLLFLNQFGIDLFIYNPAGHRDIERYVDSSAFDVHELEDIVFDQHWRAPSLFKRIVSHNFFS